MRQIDEKQAQARAALAAGNYEQARKLAEEAIALAERSASAVTRQVEQNGKTVTQTVVSEGQAAATAIGEIKEAAGIADAALKGLGDAHKQAASAAGSGADDAKRALASVSDELGKLRQQLLHAGHAASSRSISRPRKTGIEKLKALTEAQQLVAQDPGRYPGGRSQSRATQVRHRQPAFCCTRSRPTPARSSPTSSN